MTLNLEAGKKYRMRDGRETAPLIPITNEGPYVWLCQDHSFTWTAAGAYFVLEENGRDLVGPAIGSETATALAPERRQPFKVGDVVTLKSGGMRMTVVETSNDCCGPMEVKVEFAERRFGVKEHYFDPRALEIAMPPAEDIPF